MDFDLHMHSNYSNDGEYTPTQLIQMAHAKGIKTVALADHNQMLGIDEMINEGSKYGMQVIPAIECDTKFEGFEVHVLAYGLDYNTEYFKSLNKKISDLIYDSTKTRLELFETYFNIKLDIQRLMDMVGEKGKMIDAILDILNDPRYKDVEAFHPFLPGGEQSDSPTANFYWKYCFKGAPCYVDVAFPSLEDTVKEIHKAGGIAVLAHPWKTFYQREDLLEKAISQGIDGIEAYSNYHNDEQNIYYEAYCDKHHLLMTCGSDFHGATKPKIQLGEYGYKKNDGQAILAAFNAYLK